MVEGENNLERRLCVGMNELPRDQNSLVHRIEPEIVDPRRSTRLLGQQLDYHFPARHTLRSETGASPKDQLLIWVGFEVNSRRRREIRKESEQSCIWN